MAQGGHEAVQGVGCNHRGWYVGAGGMAGGVASGGQLYGAGGAQRWVLDALPAESSGQVSMQLRGGGLEHSQGWQQECGSPKWGPGAQGVGVARLNSSKE